MIHPPASAPVSAQTEGEPWVKRLRAVGTVRYHHRHPFNLLMHAGRLSRADLALWVANRYYYQTRIPIKDALILAKADDPAFRRAWRRRIVDHDGPVDAPGGAVDDEGGLALWKRLGQAVGLSAEELDRHERVLPAVKSVCDDYVELVRSADLVVAVASSLTECFAGDLMRARIAAWRRHYPWVGEEALAYFAKRVSRSGEDADLAMRFVREHAVGAEQRRQCIAALERKCEILWSLLDAVYIACRRSHTPRLASRVALRPPVAGRPRMLVLPEKGLELNATASAIVERARGDRTLGEIVLELSQQHGVPVGQVEMDVATFVGELECRRLLELEPSGAEPSGAEP